MAANYTFTEYQESDRQGVLELMQDTFASENMRKVEFFNFDYWKWQYLANPAGKAITLLAKDHNRIIGQYANIPARLKLNGKFLNSVTVIDLMVRPEYRRQGLFKKMGEAANQQLAQAGVALSLAFPSRSDSYSGFINKLGWFKVGDLPVMVKLVWPLTLRRKTKLEGRKARIEKVSVFPAQINQLWERLKTEIPIGIERNQSYLNWRYFKNPSAKYEVFLIYQNGTIAGYLVLRIMKTSGIKIGVIVDMLCWGKPDILKAAVTTAIDFIRNSGASLCAILKTKLYENSLRKLGFLQLPTRLSPKNYSLIARVNQPGLDLTTLSNIDNWFLMFGDWDLV